MPNTPKILYTLTDEAPFLATQSLLPIVQAFTATAGIDVETRDISLAGRLLAQFPERLKPEQKIADDLAELGQLATTPAGQHHQAAQHFSASVPQLKAAIAELQSQGYALPDYPEEPKGDAGKRHQGALRPASRAAPSTPCCARATPTAARRLSVKAYARKHPHRMGAWSADSRSHVAHMDGGDFYGSEQSKVIDKAGTVSIELTGSDGTPQRAQDQHQGAGRRAHRRLDDERQGAVGFRRCADRRRARPAACCSRCT